jgi:hypothetical protein
VIEFYLFALWQLIARDPFIEDQPKTISGIWETPNDFEGHSLKEGHETVLAKNNVIGKALDP